MSPEAEKLLRDALNLPEEERARMVAELLASLEPDVPGEQRSEQEWIAEVERRARAALAGDGSASWADVRARVQDRLAGK